MSTKPEAGQWWVNDTSGDKVYFIGRCASGIMVFQVDGDEVEHGDLDWSGWHHARCDEPDQPQPAEDPDEWVLITDRDHTLRSCDQFMNSNGNWWPVISVGKTVREFKAENNDAKVRCRRRDLPKVEPEQWPKYYVPVKRSCSIHQKPIAYFRRDDERSGETFHTDGTSYCFDEWTDNLVEVKQLTEACAMAWLDKPQPQPQKTRVRLWASFDDNGRAYFAPLPESYRDSEIHHDSEGFYVEDQQ